MQHRVWRPRVLEAWRLAGIGPGQTVLDVGCGPGYATLDVSELVGPTGRVAAVDKSERFLQALQAAARERGIANVTTYAADFDAGEFPQLVADAAWCRWVFAFVRNPREMLRRVIQALAPEGVLIVHEYFDYATWRAAPLCSELEEFVGAVMTSWRDSGGEPDIALSLPRWMESLAFKCAARVPYSM